MYRVYDVILCSDEVGNTAIAIIKARLFDKVNVQQGRLKMYRLFCHKPLSRT